MIEVEDRTVQVGSLPHGACDCRQDCQCAIIPGPAAYSIKRDDKDMKVCTRCIWVTDKDKKILMHPEEPCGIYIEYDPLGALVIAMEFCKENLAKKENN